MASYRDILSKEAPETLKQPKRSQFSSESFYNKALNKFKSTGNRATPSNLRERIIEANNGDSANYGAGSKAPMPTKAKIISMKKAKMAKRK